MLVIMSKSRKHHDNILVFVMKTALHTLQCSSLYLSSQVLHP